MTEKKCLIVCARCLGARIQVLDWVDPNEETFIGGGDSKVDVSHTWCEDCEDNTGIEIRDNT